MTLTRSQANEDMNNQIEQVALPLAGKKVYSAGLIAVYTILGNVAVGCVLYGCNLQARGSHLFGRVIVVLGIAGGLALLSAAMLGRGSAWSMGMLNLFTAFCLYKFERVPVQVARRNGATPARWWPPAIVAFAIATLFLVAEGVVR